MKQSDILEAAIKYAVEYGVKMNRSDISQYVNGKVVPSQEKLTVLSKALGVSEPWLMGYDVPKNANLPISNNGASIASRINEALRIRGLKQADIVERTGIGKSSISTYLTGEYEPKQKNLYLIAKALDVNEAWLTGLDAPMERQSQTGNTPTWITPLANAYVSAIVPTQENVCKLLDIPHVVPGEAPEEEPCTEPFRVSDQAAAAGTGVYLGPEEFHTVQIVEGCLPQNAIFGVPVAGNSMEPKYHDGDILIVSKEKAQDGQIGVFTMDGMGYVKRLKGGYLESLNQAYDDIPISEDCICNGLVIGVLDPTWIVEE